MQTTTRMARYVCDTGYDDFDPEVSSRAKDLCLSALGSALCGSRMELSKTLMEYVREAGSPPEAGIIGAGFRTSAELAALVNCSASHCTELEDVSFPELCYTCGVIPAMFALGEKLKASGRSVLEGVVLGFEITARPAMYSRSFSQGWQPAPHFGTIGAAAGAAKMLGLGFEETRNALSLAASFASGMARQAGSGAHVIEAGTSGRNGIMAATLAQRGLTGNPTIMEGMAGYWDTLASDPELDFELGADKDFRVLEVGLKAYPCCYFLQRIIAGVVELVNEYDITAEEVEVVEVQVNALFRRALRHDTPSDAEEARFSIPHSVAAALAREDMFVETFSPAKVNDPRILALRTKVKILRHPDWDGVSMASDNPLTIRMKDGRQYTKSCVTHHGDPKDPLTRDELITRFAKCSANVLSASGMAQISETVLALDREEDVSALTELLTFTS